MGGRASRNEGLDAVNAVSPEPALSRRLIRAAFALEYDQLAPAVIAKVKTGLLDMLSCAFEARTLPWAQQAIRMATKGATGPAAIVGTSYCTPAPEAAFATATLGHGLVREDMHTAAVSHLGVVIYPTLLALAQAEGRGNGRDFLVAAVCGYETGAAIGRALMDQDMVRLFRPTAITGPLAGVIAGSRLLGLDEQSAVSALGLAANTTAGLNEWPYSGGDEMFFHAGFAARNAVTAVQLATLGARASETALDGPSGLFASFGKSDRIAAVAPFSRPALEISEVYYKPAPACNYAQTACQAAVAIAGRISNLAEVSAITVKASAAALRYPGCDYAGPFDRVLQAKMSIQYCVAATLVCGTIEEANYHLLAHPEIVRLAGITKLETDSRFTAAYPGTQGAEVVVQLSDGQALREHRNDVVPATPAEVRARFRAAAGSAASMIEDRVEALELQDDLAELCSLMGSA